MFFCSVKIVSAQFAKQFFVQFKYKKSNYSLQNPLAYLSNRSIERRNRQGIAIDSFDLPVVKYYVDSVANLGLQIVGISKWLNGAIVNSKDTNLMKQVLRFPFVKNYVQVKDAEKSTTSINKFSAEKIETALTNFSSDSYYGYAASQIIQMNGDDLHRQGKTGEGMQIAILDAGFINIQSNPTFRNLWQQNRILGFHNFVFQIDSVFKDAAHGAEVLSTMATNLPNTFVGTAPAASFYLFETEDGYSENPVEEYYWSLGAEKADSAGADLINTSLGYNQFDNPKYNHTYADMDGKTTPCAKAASIAGSRGMLICISAGNEGQNNWRYIGTPTDAFNILSIGAVDVNRAHARFSSFGPSVDGRVKPDVCAMGENAAIITSENYIANGSGTSFSSPILCGLAACLWQKYPTKNAAEIRDAIRQSANLFLQPNDSLGYGIPDFRLADYLLSGSSNTLFDKNHSPILYPNPSANYFCLYSFSDSVQTATAELFDVTGKKMLDKTFVGNQNTFQSFKWNETANLSTGLYLIDFKINGTIYHLKFVKQ